MEPTIIGCTSVQKDGVNMSAIEQLCLHLLRLELYLHTKSRVTSTEERYLTSGFRVWMEISYLFDVLFISTFTLTWAKFACIILNVIVAFIWKYRTPSMKCGFCQTDPPTYWKCRPPLLVNTRKETSPWTMFTFESHFRRMKWFSNSNF